MHYYEVLIADSKYRSESALTYASEKKLPLHSVVTVPLRNGKVSGFIVASVPQPAFAAKPITAVLSDTPLPPHIIELARWISQYYACSLSEALRQFAPNKPISRLKQPPVLSDEQSFAKLSAPPQLTDDQKNAITQIQTSPHHSVLLHGDTATGKTEVYVSLANQTLAAGKSVIILTPEIVLTPQLTAYLKQRLSSPIITIHSHQTAAERKRLWLQILEAKEPLVVVGPRSALFVPLKEPGLIIVDEAHEPAYKQEQSPRYHAVRVASRMAQLCQAKAVLGSATPDIVDYWLAGQKKSIIRMVQIAKGATILPAVTVVDIKDRSGFSTSPFLSDTLLAELRQTISAGNQAMVFLNRRGTARMIICSSCGWQLLCQRCDVGLVYHGDKHSAVCHSCGYAQAPPPSCPTCGGADIIYKSIGTKAVHDELQRLLPTASSMRFDSDNSGGERIENHYKQLVDGSIQLIVGTQLLAKGLDLPRLTMVGIVIADSSLSLPEYHADERMYQLLTQVMGRVGRGHRPGNIVLQAYQPHNVVLGAAAQRDWDGFYRTVIAEREAFHYPPFSHLLLLICRRATQRGARQAADKLAAQLESRNLPIAINGPVAALHEKAHGNYVWHIIVRSNNRQLLSDIAHQLPSGWQADLDPISLL